MTLEMCQMHWYILYSIQDFKHSLWNIYVAWNFTSQALTHASAPALINFPSAIHNTALTPPIPAFLMLIRFDRLATLQTYTSVSKEPEAQCWLSAVQDRELTRAVWKDHLPVIRDLEATENSVIFPLDWIYQVPCKTRSYVEMGRHTSPAARWLPSGEKATALTTPLFPSSTAVSFNVLPSH
jgi:hypothetical protein